MKEIPATRGFVALVDDEDYERLARFRWYAHRDPTGFRPARCVRPQGRRKLILLYRELLQPPPGMVVDHINHDPWDNRRCNLRICTQAENMRNRLRQRGSVRRSDYKGVGRHAGGWHARIAINGQRIYLGAFRTQEDAARAYDAAAREHHGEFAHLNFPISSSPQAATAPLASRAGCLG